MVLSFLIFWIKETIGNHKITSGYLTIENKNNFDERLESVTSEISEKTQLHNVVVKNDIMKMENLNNGIVIKAKSKIDLKPGNYHIMFMKLNNPLKIMNKYKVTLKFKMLVLLFLRYLFTKKNQIIILNIIITIEHYFINTKSAIF